MAELAAEAPGKRRGQCGGQEVVVGWDMHSPFGTGPVGRAAAAPLLARLLCRGPTGLGPVRWGTTGPSGARDRHAGMFSHAVSGGPRGAHAPSSIPASPGPGTGWRAARGSCPSQCCGCQCCPSLHARVLAGASGHGRGCRGAADRSRSSEPCYQRPRASNYILQIQSGALGRSSVHNRPAPPSHSRPQPPAHPARPWHPLAPTCRGPDALELPWGQDLAYGASVGLGQQLRPQGCQDGTLGGSGALLPCTHCGHKCIRPQPQPPSAPMRGPAGKAPGRHLPEGAAQAPCSSAAEMELNI